ncbi:hypothetical protein PINS_up012807 [Pythium insidiosum]|nr:hypothetical protein PINS_up012807 [Pythium insidiosum]
MTMIARHPSPPPSASLLSTQEPSSQTHATNRTSHSAADATTTTTTTELLQSRVAALEHILSIQDDILQRQLSATAAASAAVTGSNGRRSPDDVAQLYTRLLATWRTKTVALMVQLKSRELNASMTSTAATAHDQQQQQQQLVQLTQELEMWRTRAADATAHRELERQRTTDAQRQRAQAETRAVQCVRTLALERERLQQIAEHVAVFCSVREHSVLFCAALCVHDRLTDVCHDLCFALNQRQSVVPSQLDALVTSGLRRLTAMERRLAMLTARVQLASRLVAHREARLRNSEAAIEAERRTWRHRLETRSGRGDGDNSHRSNTARLRMLLRPATEQAVRAVFQRLDPYHTGLVRCAALVDALRDDRLVRDALRGDEQRQLRLVAHVEQALRRRSATGTVRGNVTWGELVLGFLPHSEDGDDGSDADATADAAAELPPPFDAASVEAQKADAWSRRRKPRVDELRTLRKRELVTELLMLWDEREQLQRRVLDDASSLQRRAQAIHAQWAAKADDLVRANAALERQNEQQQAAMQRLETQLRDAELAASQAQHELQSLRRDLCEQRDAFQREKVRSVSCFLPLVPLSLTWGEPQRTDLNSENGRAPTKKRSLKSETSGNANWRRHHSRRSSFRRRTPSSS